MVKKMPSGWCSAPLSEVAEVSAGNPAPQGKEKFSPDGTPFVRVQDMGRLNEQKVLRETTDRVNESGAQGLRLFPKGTVLLTKSGASTLLNQRAVLGQASHVVSHIATASASSATSSDWLYYFLSTVDAANLAHGGNMPSLPLSRVKQISAPIAPLNEQHRIVEKIETLFARIDKGEEALRQVQKLLKRYRQSILKAAVTGELTRDWREANQHKLEPASDFLARILETRRENWQGRGKYKEPVQPSINELPELPQGWTWATVDQVTSLFRNGLSKKPVSEPNALPILRISAVRPMSVSLEDLRYYPPSEQADVDPFWVERGDLLFTRYSGSAKFVGVCGQLRGDIKVLHPDKLIKARPVSGAGLNRDYLELAWNTGWTRKHIAANIKTTSGQQGIAGADIKMAPFALPPLEEQKVIAERTWEAMERIASLEFACQSELVRSTNLRQSILKSAFTGQLVPQDPNDEPANELLARIRAEREAAPKKPSKKKATRKKARAKA